MKDDVLFRTNVTTHVETSTLYVQGRQAPFFKLISRSNEEDSLAQFGRVFQPLCAIAVCIATSIHKVLFPGVMIAARATQGCCSCNVAVISTVLVTLLASTGGRLGVFLYV